MVITKTSHILGWLRQTPFSVYANANANANAVA